MPRTLHRLSALAGALAVSACGVFGGAAAPEPEYQVVRRDPPFEIRAYPPLTVAATSMEGDPGGASSGAFGRLFDYISGANAGSRKIEMTAPVVMQPSAGVEIPMTAPVLQRPGPQGAWQMFFVLPKGMSAETAPAPTNPAVTLDTLPARRVAVVTFSGLLREDNIDGARRDLAGWLAAQGLDQAGPAEVAGYNPPWTLPWLRRNEILVPIAGG